MIEVTMTLDQAEEVFALDVSDSALEMAARTEGGAYTVAFCTGLDSCPAVTA